MISTNANRPLDRVVGLLCIVLLGTAVVAGSQEASAQNREPEPGTFHLHPERFELEDGSYGEAERGTYYAPMNRSRSDAHTICSRDTSGFAVRGGRDTGT